MVGDSAVAVDAHSHPPLSITPGHPPPLPQEIVDAEGSDQWTLMHRYNRASDLIEGVLQGRYGRGQDQVASAMSRVFIWLRRGCGGICKRLDLSVYDSLVSLPPSPPLVACYT